MLLKIVVMVIVVYSATTDTVLELAQKNGISYPLDSNISNADLEKLFYPDRKNAGMVRKEPDYAHIHKELAKPGDAMQVDWAGNTIPYYDSVTGIEAKAYLFVAVLPCSCYTYVEACDDMKQENWLLCHIHAYEYFGSATRLLIPDNLKTGVISNTQYDVKLNQE